MSHRIALIFSYCNICCKIKMLLLSSTMKIWIKLSTIVVLKESEQIKFCITNFVCSHYIKVSRNYLFLHKFLQIPPLGSINNTSRQKQWAEDQNKYPFLKCSICEKKNSKRAHFWLRYYRNQTGYLPHLFSQHHACLLTKTYQLN